jgi:adenylate cyclase
VGQEIERKFLVAGDGWRLSSAKRIDIVQAYVAIGEKAQVRVRIIDGERAVLTVKDRVSGPVRAEFEYPIPVPDARAMLVLRTGCLIEKTRTIVPVGAMQWEVDMFRGDLTGLVLAEIELDDAAFALTLPPWAGREVTEDARYYNAALAMSGAVPAEGREDLSRSG